MIYPKEYQINGEFYDLDAIFNGQDENSKRVVSAKLYNQYRNLRMVLGGRKCQQPYVAKVKQMLEDPEMREKVKSSLGYSDAKIDLLVFVAENELPFVR